MRKCSFIAMLTVCFGFFATSFTQGQGVPWVKQVITSNSGNFEYTPPFQDFVTLQAYNLQSQSVSIFNTIYTQSSQDICISRHAAYVASQDSIIKYDLNNFSRMAAVADSGLSRIYLLGDKLLVSKQYPVSQYFLEVLDTTDLSLVARVEGIGGDCGGIAAVQDTVYVAVNGGWMGTEGKLAVIETAGWTLQREISFGADAIGIMQIYPFHNHIITVNKSPYATPEVGSITNYNITDQTFSNTVLNLNVGNGTGIKNGLLYFGLKYGIGSMDLNTMVIADTTLVPDPGSAFFRYITSAALDTVNDRLYVNSGDYVSPGTCLVTNLSGDSITSYPTGISSDAIAVDYREYPLGIQGIDPESKLLTVYPNPATEKISLNWSKSLEAGEILIVSVTGKTVFRSENTDQPCVLGIRNLPAGMYCVIIKARDKAVSEKFIVL